MLAFYARVALEMCLRRHPSFCLEKDLVVWAWLCRVVAMYFTTRLCAQPLTPYLHMGLEWREHCAHVELVMRALMATAVCLKELQAFYHECLQVCAHVAQGCARLALACIHAHQLTSV